MTMTTDSTADAPEASHARQREGREARLKYLVALAGPLLLAAGYLWGVIYHSVRVQQWGFHSYAPALSTPDVYVQAFWALSSVFKRWTAWLAEMPWANIVVMVMMVLVAGLGLAWWKHSRTAARTPAVTMDANQRAADAWSWPWLGLSYGVRVLAFMPMSFLVLSMLSIVALSPPYFAAEADAKRAWVDLSFTEWDQATWTTDTGEKRSGYVHSCSIEECALLDAEGFAYVVPRDRVGARTNRSAFAP